MSFVWDFEPISAADQPSFVMSFPPAPHSLLGNGQPNLPGQTAPRSPILDPDRRERREKIAAVLESWDLQAMHALSSGESIAQVKLRMMKAMVGTTSQSSTVDNSKAAVKHT